MCGAALRCNFALGRDSHSSRRVDRPEREAACPLGTQRRFERGFKIVAVVRIWKKSKSFGCGAICVIIENIGQYICQRNFKIIEYRGPTQSRRPRPHLCVNTVFSNARKNSAADSARKSRAVIAADNAGFEHVPWRRRKYNLPGQVFMFIPFVQTGRIFRSRAMRGSRNNAERGSCTRCAAAQDNPPSILTGVLETAQICRVAIRDAASAVAFSATEELSPARSRAQNRTVYSFSAKSSPCL